MRKNLSYAQGRRLVLLSRFVLSFRSKLAQVDTSRRSARARKSYLRAELLAGRRLSKQSGSIISKRAHRALQGWSTGVEFLASSSSLDLVRARQV
jgi:hypothetical protein